MMWQPRADHEQKHELGDVTITRGLDATRPITEALPWQFWIRWWSEADATVRAPIWRPRCESRRDCSADGGERRLRGPSLDSFSPARLEAAALEEREGD